MKVLICALMAVTVSLRYYGQDVLATFLYLEVFYVKLGSLFTALHAMQTRSSDENSVCLSVKRVLCDKTVERSVQIYIPYETTFSLVF